MSKRKKYLTVLLIVLIILFFGSAAGGYYFVRYEKKLDAEVRKLDELAKLKQAERDLQTPTPTMTPTPTPVPTFTPMPTRIVQRVRAFDPDDFWNQWYSFNGQVSVNVYQIDEHEIGFTYHQTSPDGSHSTEADVQAELAGNGAELSFTDSWGNYAEGSLVLNGTEFYIKVETVYEADAAMIHPEIKGILQRNQPKIPRPEVPEVQSEIENTIPEAGEMEGNGEYFFADSNSRYLTDEDMESYSSDQLMLAKNEIYARHGRLFVTDYIADYFYQKSWYQGTVDPESFDAMQDSIFNDFERANIQKIAEWEEKKRNQGD